MAKVPNKPPQPIKASTPNVENKQAPVLPRPVSLGQQSSLIEPREPGHFMFGKTNFMIMLAGLVLIGLGFALMVGGKSPDPHKFNYEEIYSFRRITLAPILILLGFLVEGIAIMWVPKEAK